MSSSNMESTFAQSPFTLITAPKALVAVLAANLQAHVSRNDALPPAPFEHMTVFHALEAPAISVADYVARVAKYAFCSDACLVAALHYVNRAVAADPKLALTSLSIHRLFITAVVLACKYFDDVSYNLMYYSKVGGLPPKELANLEVSLLRILDYRLDISTDNFVAIEAHMVRELTVIEAAPMDPASAELVSCARAELMLADFAPQVTAMLVDEPTSKAPSDVRDMNTSPVSSGYSSDATLSRNASMSSVSDSGSQLSTATVQDTSDVVTTRPKRLTDSPTTPISEKHAVPIAMMC